MHGATPPTANNNANGQPITLGTGFFLTVASKTVYGVRFFVPLTNTGTYTASLWQQTSDDDPNGTGTGTLLATQAATAGTLTANTWNVILFSSPVVISNTLMYRVGVHTSSGRYVGTTNGFNGVSISGDGVTLYQSGDDPLGTGTVRNGIFLDNANGYPNTVFSATDYFVEPWVTASGLSGSLGRVSCAESARSVGAAKALSAGRVTESHTARTTAPARARTAGRVTVSEAARVVSRAKSRAIGRVVSPDAARSVSRTKVAALGRVLVADSARSMARLKAAALGRVVETSAARPTGAGLTLAISRATVAEAAGAVRVGLKGIAGRVTVTESARVVSRRKARALGRVLVAENARGILRAQAVAVARVSEASTARTVGAVSGSELVGQWGTDIGLG